METGLVAMLGRGLVDPTEPVLRADDLGFQRGDGCFETARVVTDGTGRSAVDNFDAHLARLARSVRALHIDVDLPACRDLLEQAVSAWTEPGEASVRLIVTRGLTTEGPATVIAVVHPIRASSLRQRETGITAVTLARGTSGQAFADAEWLLGGVKSLSYALNMAALREAERRGVDDAIWTSVEGMVLESPTSTVLWLDGSALRTTPTGASGILAGTTLAALFDAAAAEGFATGSSDLPAERLPAVDGLWLASSVRGVVEVIELDDVARPPQRALTTRLQKLAGF